MSDRTTFTPEQIAEGRARVAAYSHEHWPRPKLPATVQVKPSYWRDRARQAWPGLEIEGSGQFAFASQCEKMVHLFATAKEATSAVCWSGDCDPIRGHQRVKIQYLAPLKTSWEKD
jgi:hypothetical protein